MTPQPLIKMQDVTLSLGGRGILDGVSLTLAPGNIVTLIGPNGAGKTTLARVLLGLQRVDTGRLERRVGLRMGYVPQKLHMDETLPMTVERFLWVACRSDANSRNSCLQRAGVVHLAQRPMTRLSGGELQRVLLARALLRRPELLVLDEPAQGVDVTGQAAIYALLRELRNETGCAIFLISHDLHLVMAASDEVICLHHHVCCAGTPESVRRSASFRNLFPDQPELAEEIAPYRHHHDHSHDLHGTVVDAEETPHAHR